MNSHLPKTLTPADSDLRDFPYMPIDIARLFGSEFHARSNDAAWRAGMTLWLKSFHQVPAASLPNDEVALARLAELGRDLKTWRKIAGEALRGWIECDDGRLYHPVVAEKALEAWIEKLGQRKSSSAGNARRYDRPFDSAQLDSAIAAAIAMLAALNPNSRVLSKRLRRTEQPIPDRTSDPLPSGAIMHPVGSPDCLHTGPPPAPNGNPEHLPSRSQGKGREEKRRKEIPESSSSSDAVAARAKDDDDNLLRDLREAAKGRIAPACVNVGPIRRLIAQGFDREKDIMAVFREAMPNLREPLKTFAAPWIVEEITAWSEARRSASQSKGSPSATPEKRAFITPEDPRWAAAGARHRKENGRLLGPPACATGPSGHGPKGWYFPADWPECVLSEAAPREAAE